MLELALILGIRILERLEHHVGPLVVAVNALLLKLHQFEQRWLERFGGWHRHPVFLLNGTVFNWHHWLK